MSIAASGGNRKMSPGLGIVGVDFPTELAMELFKHQVFTTLLRMSRAI
jgi:hypothetical protein